MKKRPVKKSNNELEELKMKKLFVTLTTLSLLLMSVMAVSASDVDPVDEEITTNMDAATYLDLRVTQLDEALANGVISQEDYDLLLAHITENAENGLFGRGPQSYATADTEACVLGEDGGLGIFRNANSGLGQGNGNGIGLQAADGTGSGNAYKGNGGRGNQGGGARGTMGQRLQDGSAGNEDCILQP